MSVQDYDSDEFDSQKGAKKVDTSHYIPQGQGQQKTLAFYGNFDEGNEVENL